MKRLHRWRLACSACVLAGSLHAEAAFADQRFEGIWAQTCTHLSGITFTFHDDDRLKIADLDCKIVGWRKVGKALRSNLRCILDGVESAGHIEMVEVGRKLRITMDGRTDLVEHCP